MTGQLRAILAIIVVHAVIYLIQSVAGRVLTLDRRGRYGIYLMLLPVGLNCFWFEIPAGLIAAMVLAGLGVLLWAVRSMGASARAA